jgi:hypothetical protein
MNIIATIEIYAGGVGSGPNAPCPQCGPHSFKEGDRVKFKENHKITSTGGGKYQFKPDTVAKVISVMPKIGNASQMAGVISEHDQEEGKFGNVGYVKVDDLILHEPRHSESPYTSPSKVSKGNLIPSFDKQGKVIAPDPNKVTLKPVPKSQVIMHTTTNDGASLTWIKSHETSEKDLKDLSEKSHYLKGKFALVTSVPAYGVVKENKTTRVYDTSKGQDVDKGSTVWISGSVKGGKITGVNVREQNYSKYGQIEHAAYNFQYKNAAAAIGMLKSRYGITTTLKRLRGGG